MLPDDPDCGDQEMRLWARSARTVTQLRLQVTIGRVTIFAAMLDLVHPRTAIACRSDRAPFACRKHSHCDRSLRVSVFFQIIESNRRDAALRLLRRTLEEAFETRSGRLSASAI